MKPDNPVKNMRSAREIAARAFSLMPHGHVIPEDEIKKIFRRAVEEQIFTEDDEKGQKKIAWKLVTNIIEHQDDLTTEALAWADPGSLESQREMMNLLRLGLDDIIYFNSPPGDVIKDLGRIGKSIDVEFPTRILWQVFRGRINDAVFETLHGLASSSNNDDAGMTVRNFMQSAGMNPENDWYAREAENMADGIIANCELLDDALDKYITPTDLDKLQETDRIILRIGLYNILTGKGKPAEVCSAMSQLGKKCQSSMTKKFINSCLVSSARSRARALAFQILYALSFTPVSCVEELRRVYSLSPDNLETNGPSGNSNDSFAWQLTYGVWHNEKALDKAIERYLRTWSLERIGKIEHTLLRLGLYEILVNLNAPKVVISEILDLAAIFGVPDAKCFINGILDAAAKSGTKAQI